MCELGRHTPDTAHQLAEPEKRMRVWKRPGQSFVPDEYNQLLSCFYAQSLSAIAVQLIYKAKKAAEKRADELERETAQLHSELRACPRRTTDEKIHNSDDSASPSKRRRTLDVDKSFSSASDGSDLPLSGFSSPNLGVGLKYERGPA